MPKKSSKIKAKAKTKQTYSLTTSNYLGKIESEIQSNQSKLSMILGGLIILVVGILAFNYFTNKADLGPAQQTEQQGDISADNLPGKYTVKEGDTLFLIAQTYYNDGYKYTEIAKTNNLENPDLLEKGQVLEIPKLEQTAIVEASPTASETPQPTQAMEEAVSAPAPGSKGAPDITMVQQNWGPAITGDKYTVVKGDWLSKIAARAYGDILAYERIAQANNISNPDLIEVGMVLTLPR